MRKGPREQAEFPLQDQAAGAEGEKGREDRGEKKPEFAWFADLRVWELVKETLIQNSSSVWTHPAKISLN